MEIQKAEPPLIQNIKMKSYSKIRHKLNGINRILKKRLLELQAKKMRKKGNQIYWMTLMMMKMMMMKLKQIPKIKKMGNKKIKKARKNHSLKMKKILNN